MARDFLQIVRAIEGLYPKAKGSLDTNFPNQDDQLRLQITPFANELQAEVGRMRRWRLSWVTAQVVTNPGGFNYNLPVDCLEVKRIWWLDTLTGGIHVLTRADEAEIRLVKGQQATGSPNPPPPQGKPEKWAMMPPLSNLFVTQAGGNGTFNVWPSPDNQGPDGGNYTLQIDYYAEMPLLVETTCSATGGTSTLTLPTNAGSYIAAMGVNTGIGSGQTMTVRGGGNPTGITLIGNDDFTDAWLGITASAVTLLVAHTIPATVPVGTPLVFNSSNWLIRHFPKVVLFGILRELTSYLMSPQDYMKWEQRYQKEIEQLIEWDDDAESGVEIFGVATQGQKQPIFRDLDLPELYDIRG